MTTIGTNLTELATQLGLRARMTLMETTQVILTDQHPRCGNCGQLTESSFDGRMVHRYGVCPRCIKTLAATQEAR